MKPQTVLTLTVVSLVLLSGTAVAAVFGSPDIDATLSDNTVVPGEETTLDVVLVNSGDLESGSAQNPALNSEVTTARGLTVNVNTGGAPISIQTNKQAYGNFPEGKTEPIPFRISVDDDAEPGSYRVPVVLNYEYTSYISETEGTRDQESVRETKYVTVKVSDAAAFDVTNVDSNARVGSTGTVAVTVENTGSETARDASVSLGTRNQDLTVGGGANSSRFVDNWSTGAQRTFRYRVSASQNAATEPYQFDLSVAFDDEDGVRTRATPAAVGIVPDSEVEFTAVGGRSDVVVGDSGTYEVTFRNDGPVAVRDATVTIESRSNDIAFGESASTTQYVGTWQPGETRTVTVDATASDSADTRPYALAASVNYRDSEGDAGTDEAIPLGLQPDPEQSFELRNVDSTLRAGDDGTLRATLTNTGDRPVENVVLQWESDHSNLSPQETEYAVGDLAAGESKNVSFGVDASDSAEAGPRQFDFVAKYRNGNGDDRESDTLQIRETVDGSADEFEVTARNATVGAGGSATLELEITNTDDERLENIEAKVFADSPMSVGDDEAFVAGLDPGESATIAFGISASGTAMEKTYPLSVDFRYEEPDGDTPVSDSYRVPVSVTTESGGGTPLSILAGALFVSLLAIGGYLRFR